MVSSTVAQRPRRVERHEDGYRGHTVSAFEVHCVSSQRFHRRQWVSIDLSHLLMFVMSNPNSLVGVYQD